MTIVRCLLPFLAERLWLGLVLGALLGLGNPLRAGDNLRMELAAFAKDIKEKLGDKVKVVAISQFTGPPSMGVGTGSGISQRLAEELEKQKIKVEKVAEVGIEGKFRLQKDKDTEFTGMRLSIRMEAKDGEEIYKKDRLVFGDEVLAKIFGANVAPPLARGGKEEPQAHNQAVVHSIEKPSFFRDGTRVRATKDSPYAMEILVDNEAVTPKNEDGRPFVSVKRTQAYLVRLTNDTDYEAAIALSIDGISMFAFTEDRIESGDQKGNPKYSHVIIPKKSTVEIKGWHINNKQSDSFQVVEFSKSAVAEKLPKSLADVGSVTATFCACWEKDSKPPSGEPEPERYADNHSRSADATGRGPRVRHGICRGRTQIWPGPSDSDHSLHQRRKVRSGECFSSRVSPDLADASAHGLFFVLRV